MKKGKEDATPKPLLGRPTANLKMGIVGLPNVGKSTLYNALTKLSVPAENYPFCTIDPNEARVPVPDRRFDWLVDVFKPASVVPASLAITDIAGLVKGAASGEGLGNAFLSHIRAVDGIFHVVRIFESGDITHVEGALDPVRDMEIISEELRLKDVEMVEAYYDKAEKESRRAAKDKAKQDELAFVGRLLNYLREEKKEVRYGDWNAREIEWLNELQLITAKPVVYLVNMSENDYFNKKNRWLAKIKQWVDSKQKDQLIIPFSGALESKLLEMSEEDQKAYLEPHKALPAIPKIIKNGYSALRLIYFFTCGADEVRCWTIRQGTKAPQAAGVIHTDFMNGFICAEVMAYADFKEHGSESAVKAAGKYRQEGKNYTVVDGDIMFFKANTGGGLGKKK
jgi:obg-like ATPase 1